MDLATVDGLRQRLDTLRRAAWRTVALDLRGVSFMDVAGLELLVQAAEQYRSAGAALSIAGESTAVSRLLDTCAGVAEDLRTHQLPETTGERMRAT